MTKKNGGAPIKNDAYWLHRIAIYLRDKRNEAAKLQKQAGPRGTTSKLELEKTNPRLSTLLRAAEAVGGDISEMFESKVPPPLRGQDQALHEMVQSILESPDPDAVPTINRAVRSAFLEFGEK